MKYETKRCSEQTENLHSVRATFSFRVTHYWFTYDLLSLRSPFHFNVALCAVVNAEFYFRSPYRSTQIRLFSLLF